MNKIIQIIVFISVLVFFGCKKLPPAITTPLPKSPEITPLKAHLVQSKDEIIQRKTNVDNISFEIGKQFPDAIPLTQQIRVETAQIDYLINTKQNEALILLNKLEQTIKSNEEQVKVIIKEKEKLIEVAKEETINVAKEKDKVIETKEQEVTKLKEEIKNKNNWIFTIGFIIAGIAIAGSIPLALFVNPKVGVGLGISGIILLSLTWFLATYIFWISILSTVVVLATIIYVIYEVINKKRSIKEVVNVVENTIKPSLTEEQKLELFGQKGSVSTEMSEQTKTLVKEVKSNE